MTPGSDVRSIPSAPGEPVASGRTGSKPGQAQYERWAVASTLDGLLAVGGWTLGRRSAPTPRSCRARSTATTRNAPCCRCCPTCSATRAAATCRFGSVPRRCRMCRRCWSATNPSATRVGYRMGRFRLDQGVLGVVADRLDNARRPSAAPNGPPPHERPDPTDGSAAVRSITPRGKFTRERAGHADQTGVLRVVANYGQKFEPLAPSAFAAFEQLVSDTAPRGRVGPTQRGLMTSGGVNHGAG